MRQALTAVVLASSLLLAGCAGPGADGPEEGVGQNNTTFTENERGANPQMPAEDTNNTTTTGANGTATGQNGTDTGQAVRPADGTAVDPPQVRAKSA